MPSLVTILTLLAAAPMLPLVDELQRVHAPGAHVALVKVVSREVEISPVADAAAKAKSWKKIGLCPTARADGHALIIGCTTNRLHARIDDKGDVTIFKVRGLPWAASDEPVPMKWSTPQALGLGSDCPGTTAAARGECALAAGDLATARAALTEALTTVDLDYAQVRLGDLALLNDDPLGALDWYGKPRDGVWRRIAVERQCEITGTCGVVTWMFDTAAMPMAMRDELALRQLRLMKFASLPTAVEQLSKLGHQIYPTELCEGAKLLCRNVMLEGLRSEDPDAQLLALSLYASGPVGISDPARPELAIAAAEAAQSLGAPRYGAAAMASAMADVPRAQLSDYLRRVVELYLAAREPARAAAVFDYSIDTLGAELKKNPSWQQVARRIKPVKAPTIVVSPVTPSAPEPDFDALSQELASATLLRSKLITKETP